MATLDEIVRSSQYLSFRLRDEFFAVEIFRVREVLDFATLTCIPRMPDYLCGVINLRGTVVPVVDLGMQLGMPPVEKTVNTCIMIMEINIDEGDDCIQMGVLTDEVQEVINLNRNDIEDVPQMGTHVNTDFLQGMGRHEEKFLILLNADKVLASHAMAELRDCANTLIQEGAIAGGDEQSIVEASFP